MFLCFDILHQSQFLSRLLSTSVKVKFGSLDSEKVNSAKSQRINKEILANATNK